MSDVIEIGWALPPENQHIYCMDYRKRETLKSIFPYSGDTPRFYYCPPVSDYYKNCFGVYSPTDINILIENNNIHVLEGHKHSFPKDDKGNIIFDKVFMVRQNTMEYIIPDEVFVSDTENVFLEILPHPNARYKNIISSKLNIHDWFRTVHIPYYQDSVNEPFVYSVKKGEPLAMFRFVTPNDETVKLVELDFLKIKKYVNLRKHVNIFNSNQDIENYKFWKKYFKIFSKKRPKNIIDYARIDK